MRSVVEFLLVTFGDAWLVVFFCRAGLRPGRESTGLSSLFELSRSPNTMRKAKDTASLEADDGVQLQLQLQLQLNLGHGISE
jgi:hypothetical protein